MTSGTCGKNLTWTLDDRGTLTISGKGNMENYFLANHAPWYHCRASITKVIIKDSVTTIGNWAFSFCVNLTSVIIPNSVTTIGNEVFSFCENLTKVIIPNSVMTIGFWAFIGCKNLTNVIIPDSVTTIGARAFSGCKNLMSVIIPNSVTTIGNAAFSGCKNLTSVIIPDSVTKIGDWTFYHCTSLKKIYYKRGTKIDLNSLMVGNNAKLIPYTVKPPAQVEPPVQVKPPAKTEPSFNLTPLPTQMSLFDSPPPAETNCTVYRNTKISRAENIVPPNTKSLSRLDENIAEIRKAAELAAMNIVMKIERNLGFVPEDVSSQNLGYDIKSTSRDGKTLRLIEVKGRYFDAETVTVSRNEIDAALNNPDNFILVIVKLDADKNETIYLKRPFEQPPDRAALSVNFSIQKLVEVSNVPG